MATSKWFWFFFLVHVLYRIHRSPKANLFILKNDGQFIEQGYFCTLYKSSRQFSSFFFRCFFRYSSFRLYAFLIVTNEWIHFSAFKIAHINGYDVHDCSRHHLFLLCPLLEVGPSETEGIVCKYILIIISIMVIMIIVDHKYIPYFRKKKRRELAKCYRRVVLFSTFQAWLRVVSFIIKYYLNGEDVTKCT